MSAPVRPAAPDWLTARPIAHRGLHDLAAGRPENSLAAFRAAVRHGYSIECDLQPARGGVAMVFHDPVLGRLTGETGRTDARGADELGRLRLLGTDEPLPTLAAMLGAIAGRVPIVLELKGPQDDAGTFVADVANVIGGYGGALALMSFDHGLLHLLAERVTDRPLGLTAEGGDEAFETHVDAWNALPLSFVSYHVDALPCRFVSHVRTGGASAITWTVRTPEQVAITREHADQMTFEGFLPSATHV